MPIDEVVKLIKEKCRLYLGTHIATSTLWLTAATVLSTSNLSKSVDKDGRVIEPSREHPSHHVGLIR